MTRVVDLDRHGGAGARHAGTRLDDRHSDVVDAVFVAVAVEEPADEGPQGREHLPFGGNPKRCASR